MSWPALLRTLLSHVRLTLRLIREPAVPVLMKAKVIIGSVNATLTGVQGVTLTAQP